ncbi:hypothetical protein ACOSP7_020325 [Xanthoceras sorbifolium]|uniref:Protein CHUP1, chloroplastic n=1 Tax=Xanthoceras sorbifolium TaxID=99658 RepID=A0ABQ8HLZ8_9ROSI|nr:hypothetical protein JRO89_XS09G0191400 [Xanthoceras sorbifolium]
MKLGEKRDIKPILIKFGVALSLSFAGFLCSRLLRNYRTKPSLPPPPSPRSSDHGSEVEKGGRAYLKDDLHTLKVTPSSCSLVSVAPERYEETCMPKATVDSSMAVLSPSSRHSGDHNAFLLPEFNDVMAEFDFTGTNTGYSPRNDVEMPRSTIEIPKAFRSSEKDEYQQEVRHLRNMVRILRERERNLEIQLLEYYGLKEQETAVMELQNRLNINNMEAKLFALKIESLQSDNRRLEAQVTDNAKIMAELEAARSKIKMLKRKLRSEAEQNRELILALQKRVAKLQEQECGAAAGDTDAQSKLQRLKVLEDEAEELRKSNMRLQQENSELTRRLESTQLLANSVLEDPETEALKEMSESLRQENETLLKEVEQLRADRCAGVEEIVYLKWINACLRYELRNYQAPAGKTVARDLSKTLSPKSEEKAKQLILEYANTDDFGNVMDIDSDQWSSSQASSYITDSEHLEDSSLDTSTAKKNNHSSKVKFFSKLRRLIRGKDGNNQSPLLSADKVGFYEDESPQFSSSASAGTNAAAEAQSNRQASLSESSSRHSLDIPRLRSVKEDEDRIRRSYSSDMGSAYGYRKLNMRRHSASDSTPESQHGHETDLVKFAEVLKNSHGRRGKLGRNSGSFSFG